MRNEFDSGMFAIADEANVMEIDPAIELAIEREKLRQRRRAKNEVKMRARVEA